MGLVLGRCRVKGKGKGRTGWVWGVRRGRDVRDGVD